MHRRIENTLWEDRLHRRIEITLWEDYLDDFPQIVIMIHWPKRSRPAPREPRSEMVKRKTEITDL